MSVYLTYRVDCRHHMCGWAGYRRGGAWSSRPPPALRIHPAPCPHCGGEVIGLLPRRSRPTARGEVTEGHGSTGKGVVTASVTSPGPVESRAPSTERTSSDPGPT